MVASASGRERSVHAVSQGLSRAVDGKVLRNGVPAERRDSGGDCGYRLTRNTRTSHRTKTRTTARVAAADAGAGELGVDPINLHRGRRCGQSEPVQGRRVGGAGERRARRVHAGRERLAYKHATPDPGPDRSYTVDPLEPPMTIMAVTRTLPRPHIRDRSTRRRGFRPSTCVLSQLTSQQTVRRTGVEVSPATGTA